MHRDVPCLSRRRCSTTMPPRFCGAHGFAWEELSEEARPRLRRLGGGQRADRRRPRRRTRTCCPHGASTVRFPRWRWTTPRAERGSAAGAARLGPAGGGIGFGGDFLLDRAASPDTLFLGYETKTKAARLCLQRIERYAIDNLWLSDDDCRFNLPRDRRRSPGHGPCSSRPWWKGSLREALILAAVCRPVGGEAAAGRAAAFQSVQGVRRVGRLPRGAARRFGT